MWNQVQVIWDPSSTPGLIWSGKWYANTHLSQWIIGIDDDYCASIVYDPLGGRYDVVLAKLTSGEHTTGCPRYDIKYGHAIWMDTCGEPDYVERYKSVIRDMRLH